MKRLFVAFVISSAVFAAGLPTATPESAGFSKERLNRINLVMDQHVQAGRLAGASGLIARNGKIVFRNQWGEMKADSIVRMYSMTKGVTGVAAMILYEEGKFSLTDPLSKYLPEFKDMKVGKERMEGGKKIGYSVPAEHPILVVDLFRHTSGLDYMGPIDEKGNPAYAKIQMPGGAPRVDFNLEEAVKRLASVPLNDEPGTQFRYGYSVDVLGRLVEVLSGETLDRFFEDRIFKPLAMNDTAFYVAEDKWPRLATLYSPKREGGIQKSTGGAQESFKHQPSLFLGGAGLTSTLDDYAKFYQMLLNGGEYDGVRILGRKTVDLMRSDHLGNLPHFGGTLPEYAHFGLTFAIDPDPGKMHAPGSAGTYWWGGAAGTRFWIDPQEHLFGIFLIQILPPNVQAGDQ
ncbi:MAG TPA: serine hydrolase domain-containing protein, partial [Bryobacteraceae bacterium]|nr:serine hydrolase domain-containing protein [Bryobacteraceae bacterium]